MSTSNIPLAVRTTMLCHRTGIHTVADVYCLGCNEKMGWYYLKASDTSQKYKEGMCRLENFKLHPILFLQGSISLNERSSSKRTIGSWTNERHLRAAVNRRVSNHQLYSLNSPHSQRVVYQSQEKHRSFLSVVVLRPDISKIVHGLLDFKPFHYSAV